MSISTATEGIRFAVPPAFQIHRQVLAKDGVAGIRDYVTRVLGNRPPPAEGEADRNWSVQFRTLMVQGHLKNPGELVGVLRQSEVPALCREILGPGLVYSIDKSLLRDFNPRLRSAPATMHFDAHVFGPHIPIVTVWVPLNPVGVDAPGLAIATRPHWPLDYWNELAGRVDDAGLLYRRIDPGRAGIPQDEIYALARAEDEWPLVEPVLDVGDVMIFDHQYIHGTQPGIANPGRRMSMEVRVMPYAMAQRLLAAGLPQMFASLD
ncbi:MAG: hypothetical protein RLO51_18090 [Thalassobaculum sp.]|uniref:hypothetical protein n=1 Tax=Thalassobaculum sp. TaxID=2022740 RepID=UPI0032EAA365